MNARTKEGLPQVRRFRDAYGAEWDVVIGRESWGTLCALFVPRAAGVQIRQVVLPAVTPLEAESSLDEMDDQALNGLLERATIKEQ